MPDRWWEEEVRGFPCGGSTARLWVVRQEMREDSPLELLLAWSWGGGRSPDGIGDGAGASPAPLGRLLKTLQSGHDSVSRWRSSGASAAKVASVSAGPASVGVDEAKDDLELWTRPLIRDGRTRGAFALLYDRRPPWREAVRLWGEGFAARAASLLPVLTAYANTPEPESLPVIPIQGRLFPDVKTGSDRSESMADDGRIAVGIRLPHPAFIPGVPGAVGISREFAACCADLNDIAESGVNVLIQGESGTGKEIIARALHRASCRSDGPFVGLNCAALPETLFESELFGHQAGAFTGALGEKRGLLEAADGGTFFLDEIGDMPIALQIKLLRVMQERRIRRVGDLKGRSVDVRIVAATHKNLEEEVGAGRFRLDFFYRLKVIQVSIPPLRARPEDITHLLAFFLRRAESGRDWRITERALSALQAFRWPGNVRQLENEADRLLALHRREDLIRLEYLSPEIRKAAGWSIDTADLATLRPLSEASQLLERYLIRKAIAAANGCKAVAARRLGLSRQGLYKKISRYGMRDLVTSSQPGPLCR